ncbi:hypothetical protein ACHAWF_002681 [Thalassiosira exigua]
MGMILEHKGDENKALRFYHASLRYAVKYKDATERRKSGKGAADGRDAAQSPGGDGDWLDADDDAVVVDEPFSLEGVQVAKTTMLGKDGEGTGADDVGENGEVELFLEKRFDWGATAAGQQSDVTKFFYDELFVPRKGDSGRPNARVPKGEGPEVDISMTLHQIGQIHRRGHRYAAALSAYNASLRGMKEVFGKEHGNIAAILGNIGNLYMETGDYDEAFSIYQEVLGIETMHLGLSHPEVAVTLHNIATIECSRGNYPEGVSLYKQVADMQKIRYGREHLTVAVTLSCLADAYEKLRNVGAAIRTYEEALRIRIAVLGGSHLDVGRLMHKLGRLTAGRGNYAAAEVYLQSARVIYDENRLPRDHVFVREMDWDDADIQAGLAFKGKK